MDTIRFSLSWSFGKEVHVEASKYDRVGDVLAKYGVVSSENVKVIVIYKGQIINEELSCMYYGIKDKSKLVICEKRKPKTGRAREFLRSLNRDYEDAISFNNNFVVQRNEEIARITDRNLNTWEMSPDRDFIYNSILSSMKAQDSQNEVEIVFPTKVTKAESVSKDPLPHQYSFDSLADMGGSQIFELGNPMISVVPYSKKKTLDDLEKKL